jgi:hypothetical protein
MTRHLNFISVSLSAVAVMALVMTENAFATETESKESKPRTQAGLPFNMVGVVSRHGVDTCMEGNILYDLSAADHKTSVWLSVPSKTDQATLEKAVQDGSSVRVRGRWQQGLRPDCRWVKVSSVRPAGKRGS